MGRKPQKLAEKGSKKWLQDLVNHCPEVLNRELVRQLKPTPNAIDWLSPLESDEYAEYLDDDFIDRLGIQLDQTPLKSFWPRSGPRWDGLGKTSSSQVLLVEAKAHIKELNSPATGARGRSLTKICESLESTKQFIRAKSAADWSTCFYQYTNRLAHLYFLREKNGVDAFLVFLCFLNAEEMAAADTIVPKTREEWETSILLLERLLGIPSKHKLSPYIIHVFIDVREIESAVVS